jgi:histidinol-phosphate/aromatic aminotransferase/cobyric acid decarboxylase-like protein/N-acyl-L-homoserine lactone synthetase
MGASANGSAAPDERIQIRLASPEDRRAVYRLRHRVYAEELRQHATNDAGELTDALDTFNLYIVAALGDEIAGCISVTPPGRSYSVDKYLRRAELPFPCDDGLYETRLLTVRPEHRQSERGTLLAGLLIYAAFRWIEAQGGRRVVGIGRREVLGLYRKVGLVPLGRQIQSGAVEFELMSATVEELRGCVPRYASLLQYVEPEVDWRLAVPYRPGAACDHGGAFFQAVGEDFDRLERRRDIINADVLDAWFLPAPAVIAALREQLGWLMHTSPPADGSGLVRTIARVRGVNPECVLLGAGSSDLIFRALSHWLTPSSRVLLLDPTYGEYAHVAERVVGCTVERLALPRDADYGLDPEVLEARLANGHHDLAVVVNPNNPTGQHAQRAALEAALRRLPDQTRVWVDEAYIDYGGPGQSLERFATTRPNVAVCKSLSKGYALSGMRVGYLCGAPAVIAELERLTPPWVVGLPAQIAAVRALESPHYYADCYRKTHELRGRLMDGLCGLDDRLRVIAGIANYVLCQLPDDGPDALTFVSHCRARGLFVRDVSRLGSVLGRRAIRIAVKEAAVQQRLLAIMADVLALTMPRAARSLPLSVG